MSPKKKRVRLVTGITNTEGTFCPTFRKQLKNLLKQGGFALTSKRFLRDGPSDVGLVVEPGVGKAAQG